MIEFTSFARLGGFIEEIQGRVPAAIKETLSYGAIRVIQIAYSKFGHYQTAVGPFSAWQSLAQTTLQRRARRGINPANEPLLESGALRESYEIIDDGEAIVIGSAEPQAGVMETGDGQSIPARAVLGPAIIQAENEHINLAEVFVDVLLHGRTFKSLRKSRASMLLGVTPGYGGKIYEVEDGD